MWSFFGRKIPKAITGLCIVSGGALTFYYLKESKVLASTPFKSQFEPVHYDPPRTFSKWDDNWDRRAPNSLIEPNVEDKEGILAKELEMFQPKVVRHIILIRHGQYNTKGRTDEEKYLTELGRIQAEHTGKRLKDLNFPFTMMVKSTMTRAQETGSIISAHLPKVPVLECNFIREGMPIGPEPPSRSGWKPEVFYYRDGARIEAAFRKYFHRADAADDLDHYVLIVCHANVIRYFVCRALQFPAEGWLRISLPHASITWISIMPNGKCILRCLGDTGHMPPNMVTTRPRKSKSKKRGQQLQEPTLLFYDTV